MKTSTLTLLRRLTRRGLVAAGALGLAVGLCARPAQAQRGEHYALREPLAVPPTPDDGFPGPLDTQLAPKGSVVVNVPASSVYVGVTRDLTVGTVLWSYVPLADGLPSGSILARYRLGESAWFRSTLDLMYFGMLDRREQDRSLTPITAGLLGSNTELVLSDRQRLTVSGWLGRIAGEPVAGADASATAVLLGGTYSVIFARWAALHLTGLYLVSGTGGLDGAGLNFDVDWTNRVSPGDRLLARGLFSLRAGRWQFGVGASRTGSLILPWINVGFQIGG